MIMRSLDDKLRKVSDDEDKQGVRDGRRAFVFVVHQIVIIRRDVDGGKECCVGHCDIGVFSFGGRRYRGSTS